MLKNLRNKKTAKRIWIVLAILILPAFVLWGSGSLVRNKDKNELSNVGKIAGKDVSYLQYKDSIEATKNQAIMQFGDKLSEVEKYLNLESQAWDRLIMLSEAKKRKIHAFDKEVTETIANNPLFQRNGQFNNKTYEEMLRYVFHAQARTFEEQTRQNIILSKLYKTVTDKIKISDKEVLDKYTEANEQLSLFYITAAPSDFSSSITATEQELKEYFEKNSLEFKQPLSFNLEYLVTDSREKIQGIISRINQKETINNLIKDTGLVVKETGLFSETSPIPEIGWAPQVTSQLLKATTGSYLSAVQIDKNFYLFRVKERKETFIPDFEKIKTQIKEKFIQHKAEISAQAKIDECLQKLIQDSQVNPASVDFEKAAKQFGLKSGITDLFKYGSYIQGIGASDTFWTKTKNLQNNELSEIIQLPSGFYLLKLKTRVAIDEKKFQEEKAAFTARLESQKKQEFFSNFSEEFKKDAQLYK